MRRAARSLRGREVEWDVWNEPDNPAFWNGTREQFFAVYETAARALVDELGEGAVVGGPEHDEGPAGVARGPAPALPRARLPGRVPVVPREPRGG